MLEGKNYDPPLVPWRLFPYSSRPKETFEKNPVAPLFSFSKLFENRSLLPSATKVSSPPPQLVRIGIFSHPVSNPWMSKYSFTTNPISSVYRLVPPNKPWEGEFSRVYAVQVRRHFDPPDIRGEIESNLTLQRCKEGFTNRVTIITSKCVYSWNRFLHVWIK